MVRRGVIYGAIALLAACGSDSVAPVAMCHPWLTLDFPTRDAGVTAHLKARYRVPCADTAAWRDSITAVNPGWH